MSKKPFFKRKPLRACDQGPMPKPSTFTCLQISYWHDIDAAKGVERKLRIEAWDDPTSIIKAADGNQCFTRWISLRTGTDFLRLLTTQLKHGNITPEFKAYLEEVVQAEGVDRYFGQVVEKPEVGKWTYFENQFVMAKIEPGEAPVVWLVVDDDSFKADRFSDFFAKGDLRYSTEAINKLSTSTSNSKAA